MWLIIKLIIACIAGLIRLSARSFSRFRNRTPDYIHEGTSVFITTSKNKGQIVSTTFSTALATRALFRLTVESSYDRWFKKLGLSTEIQSGDLKFDERVYIACDHPIFADEIQSDAETRRLILLLFEAGASSISYNGEFLQVRFPGDHSSKFDNAHHLAELQKTIASMDMHRPAFWGDPYVFRALVAEVIIWVFAGYAFSGFMELMMNDEDYHLYPIPLYIKGFICGVAIAVLLVVTLLQLFKGSSRGHRILIEAGIVLGFSLPLGGICLISDLNRELDRSEPIWLEAPVTQLEERVHRRRRGGKRYTYYMHLSKSRDLDPEFELPPTIQIDRDTYQAARVDDIARIQVGRGWLNHPWYRAIHFRRRF